MIHLLSLLSIVRTHAYTADTVVCEHRHLSMGSSSVICKMSSCKNSILNSHSCMHVSLLWHLFYILFLADTTAGTLLTRWCRWLLQINGLAHHENALYSILVKIFVHSGLGINNCQKYCYSDCTSSNTASLATLFGVSFSFPQYCGGHASILQSLQCSINIFYGCFFLTFLTCGCLGFKTDHNMHQK